MYIIIIIYIGVYCKELSGSRDSSALSVLIILPQMFLDLPCNVVLCDVFQHVHITELQRLRCMSKLLKDMIDTMPGIWVEALQRSLPGICFNLDLFRQSEEEMAMVAKLYPLFSRVKVLKDDNFNIFINSKDELLKLLTSSNRIADSHVSRGGMVAQIFMFNVQFHDIKKPICIDIPLSDELRKALGAESPTVKLNIILKKGKFKWRFDGLQKTTGAVMDMNIRSPAVSVIQQIRISQATSAMWKPMERVLSQDVDINTFMKGRGKAEEALLAGVPCTICLRDSPQYGLVNFETAERDFVARRCAVTDVSSLCLDVGQVNYVAHDIYI